jgi:hypothetical protein
MCIVNDDLFDCHQKSLTDFAVLSYLKEVVI